MTEPTRIVQQKDDKWMETDKKGHRNVVFLLLYGYERVFLSENTPAFCLSTHTT